MKRFRFSLRPVSILRSHRESQAREAFVAAARRFVEAEEKLARIRARKAQFEFALLASRGRRFDPSGSAQALVAYRHECAEEAAEERAVTTARKLMSERRVVYVEARRQVEVVETLEQKARIAHRREALREEQAEFDDFAGRAAHRQLSHA